MDDSSHSKWPSSVIPQSLCNRRFWWRLCVVSSLSFFDGMGAFVIYCRTGPDLFLFLFYSNLNLDGTRCLEEFTSPVSLPKPSHHLFGNLFEYRKKLTVLQVMPFYINITFLRGDIVDCHPEETLSTEAEPRLTMLFDGWQSTVSPLKKLYLFNYTECPISTTISQPWDIAVWHSKLRQLTNQIAGN